MLFSNFFLAFVLQWSPVLSQVYFNQPSPGELIMGGVPFIVSLPDSFSAPYFSQMTNYTLLLLAGNYSSPSTLYAWNLSTTPPNTVSNCITFPRSVGPNSTDYFLGISGSLYLNTSISVTYFSSLFTLQNMTGPSSVIPLKPTTTISTEYFPYGLTTLAVVPTSSPGRQITCQGGTEGEVGGYGGVENIPCEYAALNVLSVLQTQTRSPPGIAAPLVTTPPAVSAFAVRIAATATTTLSLMSGTGGASTPASSSQPTNTNGTSSASGSSSTSSRPSVKMVYTIIVATLTLATVVLLFWIWARYRRRQEPRSGCDHRHPECDCSRMRKMWDRMSFPRLGAKAELDVGAEKGGGDGFESMRSAGIEVLENRETVLVEAGGEGRETTPIEPQLRERTAQATETERLSRRFELEGSTGMSAHLMELPPHIPVEPPTPPPIPLPVGTQVPVLVGKGKHGMVIKGKDAAIIVAVKKSVSVNVSETNLTSIKADTSNRRVEETRGGKQNMDSNKTEVSWESKSIAERRRQKFGEKMGKKSRRDETYKSGQPESSKGPLGHFVSIT